MNDGNMKSQMDCCVWRSATKQNKSTVTKCAHQLFAMRIPTNGSRNARLIHTHKHAIEYIVQGVPKSNVNVTFKPTQWKRGMTKAHEL